MKIHIFAHDPGPLNYGYAILRATIVKPRTPQQQILVEPVEHGVLQTTINVVNENGDTQRQMHAYDKWVRAKIARYKPAIIAAERFIPRGRRSGNSAEYVGFMLGTLMHIALDNRKVVRSVRYIQASTWKNAARFAGVNLDVLYEWLGTPEVRRHGTFGLTAHQVDAYLIGVFMIHRLLGLKGFEFLGNQRDWLQELIACAPKPEEVRSVKRPTRKKTKRRRKRRAGSRTRTSRIS